MPSASAAVTTSYSMGRVLRSASVSNAADRASPKSVHTLPLGPEGVGGASSP